MSMILAYASNYGSSYGSSNMDINDVLELLGASLCCYLIPAILSMVAVIWGAHMAQQKGRSAGAWTALTLFFGIIPFIVLCCLPSLKEQTPPPAPSWLQQQNPSAPTQSWSAPTAASAPNPAPENTSIVVTCPSCQRKMKVGAKSANSRVRCPSCQGVITLIDGKPQTPDEK